MKTGKVLHVKVVTRAKENKIIENDDGSFTVRVTTVPEHGKANAAVLKLLAKQLGVGVSSLTILQGETSRKKTILVSK